MVIMILCLIEAEYAGLFSSLILSGAISSMNQQYENAETFFQKATYSDPNSMLAWTMQGKVQKLIVSELYIHKDSKWFNPDCDLNFMVRKTVTTVYSETIAAIVTTANEC